MKGDDAVYLKVKRRKQLENKDWIVGGEWYLRCQEIKLEDQEVIEASWTLEMLG